MKDLKIIKKAAKLSGCNLLMVCRVGSELYGTRSNTSDNDYAGVYVPNKWKLYLQDFPKTITFKKGDLDVQLHSIYHFRNMLEAGDSKAIEMVNITPNNKFLLLNTAGWELLIAQKEMFLTKKIFNFVRFTKSQAIKYGLKGERYNVLKTISDILKSNIDFVDLEKSAIQPTKMELIWNKIPRNKFVYDVEDSPNGVKRLNIRGKIIQATAAVDYVLEIVQKPLKEYGDRAKHAAKMNGADWKALSHAYKSGAFIYDLCKYHKLEFPLSYAPLLSDIKLGKLSIEETMSLLENIISEANYLQQISNWPDTVDEVRMNNLIVSIIDKTLKTSNYSK